MMKTEFYSEYISFCKTRDPFGELSNMAAGFPIAIAGTTVRTSEALYQALKFPDNPEVQQEILDQKSPMAAKMKAKSHLQLVDPKWFGQRDDVMWRCLVEKTIQHNAVIMHVLSQTQGYPIVEFSRTDDYWGAVPIEHMLVGQNRLGKMWERIRAGEPLEPKPLGLKLLGVDV